MANKAKSIVFVDAGIEAPLQLAAGIAFDAEILLLSPHEDGVAQITAALQARPQVAEVSIVAHGAPGQISLGNAELSLATLSQYGDRLRQWTAQTAITEIRFYGCRVAAGDAGAEFLAAIHTLTHANIAASTHLLGHADRGGDWTLDAFWGEVERRSLLTAEAVSTYPGLLNNNVGNATPITPDPNGLAGGNATANSELNEPLHDPTLFGANLTNQTLANDSVWWSWTRTDGQSGLVNVNTEGSSIGTVLAVYSGPAGADADDFGSFISIETDFSSTAASGASVTFDAVNGVTYYFAVDGVGTQKTATDTDGIAITLDVPPIIEPAQVFTVPEDGSTAPIDDDPTPNSVVNVTGTVQTWAITAGNPDNDGDNNPAFAIDPTTGALSVNDPGDLDFEGFPAIAELTVTATDAAGFTDSETVFVQVTNVNEAPEITSLSAPGTISEGSTITLTGQVEDPDAGDTQTVTITWGDGTPNSTAIVDSSGSFTAVHTYLDDFSGNISATVVDTQGATGTTDPVTRPISVLNVAPDLTSSVPLNFTVAEDGTKSFFLTAEDVPADTFTWSAGAPSRGGTLTAPTGGNPTQFFTYTPKANFNGTETFEIQVRDDDGGTDTLAFNVTVSPVADAPTSLNLTASDNTITEGDTITLNGSFIDPDVGDTFTVTINWNDGTASTVLSNADLTFNSVTNTYFFNANHQFLTNENASVTVTVQDSFGKSAIASESIIIENEPPTLTPASTFIEIDEDTSGTKTFTATDQTATTFDWSIATAPTNGTATVSLTDTGAIQDVFYTPNADFFGQDNFSVAVSDGDDTTIANVAVFVNPVNDAPTDLDVTLTPTSLNEGATIALSGSFIDVDNDPEPLLDDVQTVTVNWGDGTVETFTEADTDGGGNLIIDDTTTGLASVSFGNITHKYADEGDGTYTVIVTVTDDAGESVSTTQEVKVFNVAPEVTNPDPSTLAILEDTPTKFTVTATDVGVNDVLTWTVFDSPNNGTLTKGTSPSNGVRNFTYTPDLDFDGTDTFTLLVSDGDGGFENLVYKVNVTGVDDPPTLIVGNFVVTEDQEIPITRSLLDAQDDTATATGLTFTITGPGAGSFLVDGVPNNTFTLDQIDQDRVSFLYTNAENLGADGLSFAVEVSDGGQSTSQFVQIPAASFTAQNDNPVFVDQDGDGTNGIQLGTFTVAENNSVLITNNIIAATDEETAAANLSFTVSQVVGGNFIVRNPSTGVFEPSNTFTQADITNNRVRFQNDGSTTNPSYTITVRDGQGGTATLTGSGTVTPTNDAPQIITNSFDVTEDQAFKVTPLVLNASDEDDTAANLTFTITGPDADSFSATSFTLQQVIAGDITFLFKNEDNLTDAEGNPIGPDFTIKVADDQGAADTEVGNVVNFEAVNDLPVLDDALDVDAITAGVQFGFNLNEGTPEPLTTNDISASDEETADSNLTYTVTGFEESGDFFVAGVKTNTFTQAQLAAGNLVFFRDNGTFTGAAGESLPAFTLTVSDGDGGVVETTLTATFNTVIASAPEITANAFSIVEEAPFQVTQSILDAADIDTPDNELIFTITGAAADSFFLSDDGGTTVEPFPTADIAFTRQDILDGRVFFNYAGEDTPAFSITVSDGDAASANAIASANIVSYAPINDEPTFAINLGANATLNEDGSFFINDTIFVLNDPELAAGLQTKDQVQYTYTATNGFFADATGTEIVSFTQADVVAGNKVQFVQDGTPAAPSFTVTVQDNGFTLSNGVDFPTSESATASVAASDFTFTRVNDAPTVELNNFVIVEGTPLVIDTTVLQIDDEETLSSADIGITLLDANGDPLPADFGFSQTSFKYQDVILGNITFTWEEETAPVFQIQVTDDGRDFPADAADAGNAESTTVDANIVSFTNTDDAPVFVDQDGDATNGIQLGLIAVTENDDDPTTPITKFFTVTTDIIDATDDDLAAGENLTFTVSNVEGGTFRVGGLGESFISQTFTRSQIASGQVFFVNEGENTDNVPAGNTPNTISYDIRVNDGDPANFTTNSGTGTIIPVNDPPVLATNQFDITEGEPFVVKTDNLNVTDVDTPASRIRFNIQGADNQSFLVNGVPSGLASTAFSLQDILDENISFLYTGETRPEFTITVRDLGADPTVTPNPIILPTVDGNVVFTPVNDTPTLAIAPPNGSNTIDEGSAFFIDDEVVAGKAFFNLSDPEFAAGLQTADQLVYTYTATNGFFADVDGNEITSFTQADVAAGDVVQFIHDGSETTTASFKVTLEDNGFTLDGVTFPASESATATQNLDITLVNDVPELILGVPPTVVEGQTVTLSATNFSARDEETEALNLKFEIPSVTNGQFSLDGGLTFETNPDPTDDTSFLSFTLAQLQQQQVIFKHDDTGETPDAVPQPSFTVRVTDSGADAGGLANQTSAPETIDVTLQTVNDTPRLNETFNDPVLTSDDGAFTDDGIPFRVTENQSLVLTNVNVKAIDPDTPADELVFTVVNPIGGFFAFNENESGAAVNPLENETTTFTQAQVNDGIVVFVHDGDETSPSYTLSVTDGNTSDSELYTPTLTTINDVPDIVTNNLTLTEDTKVTLTQNNLFAKDEETGPANLTYSISNLTNGTFYLNDVKITNLTNAFTQQQVNEQRVDFEYVGFGAAPSYTLIVKDNGAGSQSNTPAASNPAVDPESVVDVAFTPINDIPESSDLIPAADFGVFDVAQGQATTITKDDILVVDEEDYRLSADGSQVLAGAPSRIVFTVDDVQNGSFIGGTVDPATGQVTFTQRDINLGNISFLHDGSQDAPTYTLTATDQGLTTLNGDTLAPKSFTFSVDLAATFTDTNDAPVLGNNQLTVNEGATAITLKPANLSATDAETDAADLTFNISNITNGFFTVNNGGTLEYFGDPDLDGTPLDPNGADPLTNAGSFKYEDVVLGKVTFTHDGSEDEPTYSVSVEDQVESGVDGTAIATDPEPAAIAFNRENDAPVLEQADGTDLVPLTVAEGGSALVSLANISATDEAGETPIGQLTFSISEVLGGSFIDVQGNITGTANAVLTASDIFTRANIKAGDLLFENDPDSNEPPTYTVTVTDVDPLGAESTSETFVGTLTATNDAPEQVTLSAIALTEGEAFTIDDAVLEYIDEESADADLKYFVTSVTGGDFEINGVTVAPGTGFFTQADVNANLVTLVDNGEDDTAPTFTLTLKDKALPTDANVNEITLTNADFQVAANFTPVNDVPTFADDTPIVDDEFITDFPQVIENQSIAIVSTTPVDNTEVKISVIDEESPATELKYTVIEADAANGVTGTTNGFFTVNDVEVQSFTQQDINDGLVEFVPQGGAAPTIELKLEDNNGGEGANALTQVVTPAFELVNQPPQIANNTLSPIEGQVIPFTEDNLSATDRESQASSLTFQIVNVQGGGTFFLNNTVLNTTDAASATKFTLFQLSTGALTFKDDGDEVLPSYDVIVSDGEDSTGPVAATIDDSRFPVNDPPTIVTADFPITEGQLLELSLANLETTDPDVDADPNDALDASTLTYTVSGPTGGTVVGGKFIELTATGVVTVTSFTQQDVIDGNIAFQAEGETPPSFKITVNDGAGGTDSVTLAADPTDPNSGIGFTPVDDPPVAVNDAFSTNQNTVLTSLNVTANDSDDGDPPVLNVTEINGQTAPVTLTSGAIVTINPNNTLNYDPGNNFKFLPAGNQATDTFTYTISDGDADNDNFGPNRTATVTITIAGLNDAPIAVADSASVFENATTKLLVLNNDSDADLGDTFSISSIDTTGTIGTVTTNGTSVLYDPRGSFNLAASATATDTFTYTIKDASNVTSTATVSITVQGVNDAPIAVNDLVNVLDNVTTTNINLTANDLDEDPGTQLKITSLNGTPVAVNDSINLALGTAELTSISTIDFTPAANLETLSVGQSQQQTFTYTVSDGNGGTSQATVTLVVNGANEDPIANPDGGFSTIEGVPITLDVLANDTDLDANDQLLISSVDAVTALGGTVLNNGDDLTYIPPTSLGTGVTDTDTFNYFMTDGNGGTSSASVTVSVTGFDGPPLFS